MAYFIEPEIIDEIQERVDIVDVIGQYVELTKAGNSYKGLCPFHSERTPSFSVSPEKNIFKCFGCGVGGSAINFLMRIENYTFPQAAKVLADMYGIEIKSSNKLYNQRLEQQNTLYNINKIVGYHFIKNLSNNSRAISYMEDRGFDLKFMRRYGIGYGHNSWNDIVNLLEKNDIDLELGVMAGVIRKSDKGSYYDFYRDRIIFPIIDQRSRVLGFGGRIINEVDNPKYLNTSDTPIYHKGSVLYNINRLSSRHKVDSIILVEGYMDVLGLEASGYRNVLATLGTALTPNQAELIKKHTDLVYIVYDGDDAGISASESAVEILNQTGIQIKVVQLPKDLDPLDYIKEYGKIKFDILMDQALDGYSFIINEYKKELDLSTIQGKSELIKYIGNLILKIKSPIERDLYIQEIADEYDISQRAIRDEIYRDRDRDTPETIVKQNNIKSYGNNDKALIELLKIMINDQQLIPYISSNLESENIHNTELREIYTAIENIDGEDNDFDKKSFLNYLEDNYIIDEDLRSILTEYDSSLFDYDIYKYIDELIDKVRTIETQDERSKIIAKINKLENSNTEESKQEIKMLLDKLINL